MLSSLIVVSMLLSGTWGQNPAIQVILTNRGLQYGKHTVAGWVQDTLDHITLPDISGEIDIHIGTIEYTLTGVTIAKCDFPEPVVEFFQEVPGIKTSMIGLSVALTGEWITRFGIIHDGGSFDMAIFSVDVTSVVELGKDADGRLSVSSISCDALVGDVDAQFHGGASWLFQIFVDHYKDHIRQAIERRICPGVEESIDNLEHHLQAMNVSMDVDPVLALDLPLTGSPVVDAASLNVGLKGEFYSIQTHKDPPFVAQPFTMPQQPAYMLSLGVSEYTVNSAIYGYYSAGLFQALIDDSMIPPSSPVRLNTSFMGPFIPQLPTMLPDLLMNLQVYARDAPVFSVQPGAAKLCVQVAVKASAVAPNGTQIPLFQLNVDSNFSGKMWISSGRLKGSMMLDNFTMTLAASEVGPFKTEALENLVRSGIKMVALPRLNEKLGKGIILPRMKHAQLVNSALIMEKGFIAISSNFQLLTERSFD